MSAVHRAGSSATVVVGADSPTLPYGHVEQAFERLDGDADAVIAPAEDGGYVLIGTREPCPALFQGIPWGGQHVVEVTRARAAGAGIRLADLPPWYDVDDAAALRRLLADLATGDCARRAPETARFVLLDSRIRGMV